MVNIPSQRSIQEWLVYWKIPLKYQLIGDKHLIMLFGFQPSQIGGAGFRNHSMEVSSWLGVPLYRWMVYFMENHHLKYG